MNLAISVKNEKTAVVSRITTGNYKLNFRGKNFNSLLKRKCEEEKKFLSFKI